jgi:hypothetical protein
MATLPPGRLTRQQIRDLALRQVGNPSLDTEAKTWLAQLLHELYLTYDWPFLSVATTVAITGPSFTLPTDFLKPLDDAGETVTGRRSTALQVATVDGLSQIGLVTLRDRATYDALAAGQTLFGVPPTDWHADYALGQGVVHPNPTGHSVVASLRYKSLPAEPDPSLEPTDVPAFPWSLYLVDALFVMGLRYEGDPRTDTEGQKLEKKLAWIRGMAIPRGTTSATIPLDPQTFRPPLRVN